MIIRDATAADAPALCAIWNPVIRDTAITFNAQEKSTADLAAMIATRQNDGHAFLLAEDAGRILGFDRRLGRAGK